MCYLKVVHCWIRVFINELVIYQTEPVLAISLYFYQILKLKLGLLGFMDSSVI